MSNAEPPPDEAYRSLDARASALEQRTARPKQDFGSVAAGEGYRLVGLLIGGALVGLAAGMGIDLLAHTRPAGTIIGVLVGFALSVFMAFRAASRVGAQWTAEHGPARDLPADEDEEA